MGGGWDQSDETTQTCAVVARDVPTPSFLTVLQSVWVKRINLHAIRAMTHNGGLLWCTKCVACTNGLNTRELSKECDPHTSVESTRKAANVREILDESKTPLH